MKSGKYWFLDEKNGLLHFKESITQIDWSNGDVFYLSCWCCEQLLEKVNIDYTNMIKGLKFPASIKVIGEQAFLGGADVEELIFEHKNNNTIIESAAFWGCINLKKINWLNAGIVRIDDLAFSKCSSLQEVELPIELQEVGIGIFSNCAKLQKIFVPQVVIARIPNISELVTKGNQAQVVEI